MVIYSHSWIGGMPKLLVGVVVIAISFLYVLFCLLLYLDVWIIDKASFVFAYLPS